jgi:hypothetical protein
MEVSTEILARAAPEYAWVLKKGIFGDAPFTRMEPWYFLSDDEIFDVAQKWPSGRDASPLIAFARYQGDDSIACIELPPGDSKKVVLIEGWHAGAYSVVHEYPTLWDWLKTAIDDVADWQAVAAESA